MEKIHIRIIIKKDVIQKWMVGYIPTIRYQRVLHYLQEFMLEMGWVEGKPVGNTAVTEECELQRVG